MGNLQGGHGVHRRADKEEYQGEDIIERDTKTKRWNPWEEAKVSMVVPRGGGTSKGGIIRGTPRLARGREPMVRGEPGGSQRGLWQQKIQGRMSKSGHGV